VIVLTLEQWLRLPLRWAGVGLDGSGQRWLWIEAGAPADAPGNTIERHGAALLSLPSDMATPEIARVLELWPAWCLVRSADVELGMSVLVVGAEHRANQIAAVCRLHGSLWLERWTEDGEGPDAVLVRLPGRPDRVFLLEGHQSRLAGALRLCRDGGTVVVADADATPAADLNLYPDAHRRGLHVLIRTDDAHRGMAPAWAEELPRLRSLLRRGLL
jgi:hypothetical protein